MQAVNFEKAFQAFDEDGDGTISTQEFTTGLQKLGIDLSNRDRDDLVRSIEFVGWKQHGETLQCSVRGPRFTYKLVRSLVGGMVAVGLGTHPIEELEDALAGRPLAVARHTAPAHGLSLRSVDVDVEWVSA